MFIGLPNNNVSSLHLSIIVDNIDKLQVIDSFVLSCILRIIRLKVVREVHHTPAVKLEFYKTVIRVGADLEQKTSIQSHWELFKPSTASLIPRSRSVYSQAQPITGSAYIYSI